MGRVGLLVDANTIAKRALFGARSCAGEYRRCAGTPLAAAVANLCSPVFTRLRCVGSADPFATASAPVRWRAGGLVAGALLGAAAAARLFCRALASLVIAPGPL